MTEITTEYDFSCDITASQAELLGVEQQVTARGIIKLDEMARLIEMINQNSIMAPRCFRWVQRVGKTTTQSLQAAEKSNGLKLQTRYSSGEIDPLHPAD